MKKSIILVALLIASCKKAPINETINNITQGATEEYYIFNNISLNTNHGGLFDTTIALPANVLQAWDTEQLVAQLQNADPPASPGPALNILIWASFPYSDGWVNITDYAYSPITGGIHIGSTIASGIHVYNLKVTVVK